MWPTKIVIFKKTEGYSVFFSVAQHSILDAASLQLLTELDQLTAEFHRSPMKSLQLFAGFGLVELLRLLLVAMQKHRKLDAPGRSGVLLAVESVDVLELLEREALFVDQLRILDVRIDFVSPGLRKGREREQEPAQEREKAHGSNPLRLTVLPNFIVAETTYLSIPYKQPLLTSIVGAFVLDNHPAEFSFAA